MPSPDTNTIDARIVVRPRFGIRYNSMISHRIQTPTQIVIGREVMATIAREQRRANRRRWLLVTEAELHDSGAIDPLVAAFEGAGLSIVTFTGFDSGSVSTAAEEALEISRASFVEAVIGFGSAPTIHLGRVVAALVGVDVSGVDEILDQSRIDSRGVAFLSVPSVPFDPLLCSPKAFVVDARNRLLRMIELETPAEYVIYDSKLLDMTTRVQTLFGLSAAMLLSVESLVNPKRDPVSAPLSARVVRDATDLFKRLSGGDEFDPEVHESVRQLSLMAALGAASTGPGLGTYLAGCIHARNGFGLSSAIPAITSPTVSHLVRSAQETPDLDIIGGDPETVEANMRELLGGVELPLRLKEAGFDERDTSAVLDNLEALKATGQYAGAVGPEDVASIIDTAL